MAHDRPYERWRWRNEVCDRLSEQTPRWAELVHVDARPSRRGAVDCALSAFGGGWGAAAEPGFWVVVYDGWMVCAQRRDPLRILWHAPLAGAPEPSQVEGLVAAIAAARPAP